LTPSGVDAADARASAPEFAPSEGETSQDSAESRNALPRQAAASDPVEAALAKALEEAATAKRWDVVAHIAGELEARRLARAGNVVPIVTVKARRRGA
jgi:hypothetical protein